MTLIIGCDHAGFELKQELITKLSSKSMKISDVGCESSSSVDYPDFVHPLARQINENPDFRGILICGSGNGVCMTANKYPNVRAALCWTPELAQLARQHNNANILCIPARFVSVEIAESMVDLFLITNFEGGRHETRVNKINSGFSL
jgi:ribose 5-phosphate isomerase B